MQAAELILALVLGVCIGVFFKVSKDLSVVNEKLWTLHYQLEEIKGAVRSK
jgi:hypothetical protein